MNTLDNAQGESPPLPLFDGDKAHILLPSLCSHTQSWPMLAAFFTLFGILHGDVYRLIGYSTESSKKTFLQSNSGPEIYRNTTLVDIQNCKYYYEMEQVFVSVSVLCF